MAAMARAAMAGRNSKFTTQADAAKKKGEEVGCLVCLVCPSAGSSSLWLWLWLWFWPWLWLWLCDAFPVRS